MATMVMYCTLPDQGGNTNFRNAGVHIKAAKGNAIFFGYIDPKSKIMDNGFTEHSGCPVFEGEKKIVTQWIRLGVDDENPWDSFNTLGIKRSEADNQ
jgi:2OG-Fe(II) oxygenase superfamily